MSEPIACAWCRTEHLPLPEGRCPEVKAIELDTGWPPRVRRIEFLTPADRYPPLFTQCPPVPLGPVYSAELTGTAVVPFNTIGAVAPEDSAADDVHARFMGTWPPFDPTKIAR